MRLLTLIILFISFPVNAAPGTSEGIKWYDWGAKAFETAKKDNKLILVNVGMEGCAACERMEHFTYQDKSVIDLLNKSYVSIAVDSEARPDIGERYSDWAWPATAFLKPNGTQVLAIAGNRNPSNFLPLLNDLLQRQKNATLSADTNTPYSAPSEPSETELTKVRNRLRAQIDDRLNETWGGWQQRGLGTEGAGSRLDHLLFRAHMYRNNELRTLALKTIDRFVDALDPVWGGVYVSVRYPNTPEQIKSGRITSPRVIPEKRITSQANAIKAYADGFQLTGDTKYQVAMSEMADFFDDWFTSPDGTFYSNQKITPPNLPDGMNAGDYWALKNHDERNQYGVPAIDHAVYTDQNAEVIDALVRAYEAFDDSRYLDMATRAARHLISTRLLADGYLLQNSPSKQVDSDARLRPNLLESRSYLSTQAWAGSAFLSLYRVTSDRKWLDHAVVLADNLVRLLEDKKLGGFFGTPDEGLPIPPRKPLEQNGRVANFYYDLWVYTKHDRFKGIAERTLMAISDPEMIRREGKITGEFALALEKVTAQYVEFSIVGNPDDERSRALFEASRQVHHPRKILHFEKAGRYPARSQPALYICNPDRCSVPIMNASLVAEQAKLFSGPAQS